jgi:hypothetical protein
MNYITDTKFFKTGYLSNDANEKREKQGRDPQFISNVCVQALKDDKVKNLPYFNTMYYPVKATPLPTYGQNPSSEDLKKCPFLKYLQSP